VVAFVALYQGRAKHRDPSTMLSRTIEVPFNPSLVMFHKQMEALKAAVRIEDYAGELTDLHFSGQSLRGICPVHGGDNRSSFAVYPDKQHWHCFRCDAGGDVVDLCQAVENHAEIWTAMLSLAQRFDVELPQRRPQWSEYQEDKAKVRHMIREELAKTYQRRLFRMVGDAAIEGIADPAEREEEARRLHEGFRQPARYLATRRMERRHA
jgi:DNA primase